MLAVQETWVQSLGWEYSLEEGMATHSSILAWRLPQTEESGGLQSMRSQKVGHNGETNAQIRQAGLGQVPGRGLGHEERGQNK